MKQTFLLISLLAATLGSAQTYFVNTDLLNVRAEPTTNSRVVNALPYLTTVHIEDRDSVFWNDIEYDGQLYFGNWIWLRNLYTAAILADDIKIENKEPEGFVFDKFLSPMYDRDAIRYEVISKSEYDKLKSKAPPSTKKPTQITNPDKILKLIRDRIDSPAILPGDHDGGYLMFKSVKDDQGHRLLNISNEVSIVGYFPEVQILKLEGGHSSDYFIDLKNGTYSDLIGDPAFAIPSVGGSYRIGGFYNGHEPVIFLERSIKGKYLFMTEIPFLFYDYSWIDGQTFIASNEANDERGEGEEVKYIKGTVLK